MFCGSVGSFVTIDSSPIPLCSSHRFPTLQLLKSGQGAASTVRGDFRRHSERSCYSSFPLVATPCDRLLCVICQFAKRTYFKFMRHPPATEQTIRAAACLGACLDSAVVALLPKRGCYGGHCTQATLHIQSATREKCNQVVHTASWRLLLIACGSNPFHFDFRLPGISYSTGAADQPAESDPSLGLVNSSYHTRQERTGWREDQRIFHVASRRRDSRRHVRRVNTRDTSRTERPRRLRRKVCGRYGLSHKFAKARRWKYTFENQQEAAGFRRLNCPTADLVQPARNRADDYWAIFLRDISLAVGSLAVNDFMNFTRINIANLGVYMCLSHPPESSTAR